MTKTADGECGTRHRIGLGKRRPSQRCGPARDGIGPPSGFTMLPWLLMGMGAIANLVRGETPNPWIGAIGVLIFNSLYIALVFRAFDRRARETTTTRLLLLALAAVTFALAGGYGGEWLYFFPLLGLATGAVMRGPRVGVVVLALTVTAGLVAGLRDGWGAISVAYGTLISGMVTAAILALSETVRELRDTRQELARTAVEKERLRFSRDLHDLLGHTLSVIVVKSEAARRLGSRDMDAALAQISDIESVGRQALTEIREAVTGYRRGSFGAELDRARSVLSAAGVEAVVRRSGPPPEPETAVLLGWVVREAVTNAVRHSGATTCEITLTTAAERVELTIADDGIGAPVDTLAETEGTGLRGLAERLAAVGGTLEAGPAGAGFRVRARLPVQDDSPAPAL
ncbi:sensor histidine kinase [Streptomyces sp. AM8-1-1]|uniref:sensor histidine kinase n=1 Tax=Streptomyces sp. AM8-1-1 TaxID=3075825 RepID=UPI0028C4DC3A|nr:sensor histidine kinase [Streptomyces sp. AM8-1-1]WNO74872.1 sensor histidine kinase [Streptomyces sp. AM8-1-1]